jgi:hypothetical protein
MVILEVRCCCDARLLGFAEVTDDQAKHGAFIRVRSTGMGRIFNGVCDADVPVTEEYLFMVGEVRKTIQDEDGFLYKISELAIKSQDYPEEIVAKLPGFRKHV